MRSRFSSLLVFLVVTLAASCSEEPDRWEGAERRAEEAVEAAAQVETPAAPKVEGGKLNAFFPAAGPDESTRVFTAEKDGYVEAKLQRDGQDLAVLSIAQAAPEAMGKFDSAAENVGGFPLVTVGKNQSSLLVAKKYQVKVSSKQLAPAERKAVLSTFDLKGLAAL